MAKVLHVRFTKLALFQLCLQLVLRQPRKCFVQVHFILISSSAGNKYVIKVNEYKIINISLYNCIYQSLECAGCVTKAQQKHSIFEQSIPCYKHCFFIFLRCEPDLMVTTGRIYGTEVLCM